MTDSNMASQILTKQSHRKRYRNDDEVDEKRIKFTDVEKEGCHFNDSIPSNSHMATKVSLVSTNIENKGVNIVKFDEFTDKFSADADRTPSTASKTAMFSLDALAKAKKALHLKKELDKKLKKIPLLYKGTVNTCSSSAVRSRVGSEGGVQSPTAERVLSTLPTDAAASASAKLIGLTDLARYEAVQRAQELATKMGFSQDTEFGLHKKLAPDGVVLQQPTKAPVLRLDGFGREIDEHGNVVNRSKPSNLSTLKVNINKQKKEAFALLKSELEVDPKNKPHFDARMGIDKNKLLRPKRTTFEFVEECKWSKEAESIKLKSRFGEAQANELKIKQAQLAKVKAEPNINPNFIEVSERMTTKEKEKEKQKEPIPEVEWWDVPLLRSGDYADIANDGNFIEDVVLKMEKITMYVEHPSPIEPPVLPVSLKPVTFKPTKKEQRKLRKLTRLAREKERQEKVKEGLIEPPKPKVKMSNIMKVMASEATQDPTKLEMEVRAAEAEREQAHKDRNTARKLTPAERREKKERKLYDNPNNTSGTIVSVYKINDLSDRQNQFKVDINAQENRLTGCAVITERFSIVVVEGGRKSIKRYGNLMLRRIKWEREDEVRMGVDEIPANKCVLVWQGSVAEPSFDQFFIRHDCLTEAAALKIFSDAGVGHYWKSAANFADE